MKISVVIPAYNGERFLKCAIESALNQSYPPSEVIVVDDGSTDGSAAVVRSYGGKVRVVKQPNAGVGSARANGIRSAKGDWVALLDQDDEFFPDKLLKQAALVKQNPGLVVVYTGVIHKYESGSAREYPAFPSEQLWPALRYRSPIVPSSALLKKSAILDIGNFDPLLRMCDDWDIWLRLALRFSTKLFAALPEPLTMYRFWSGNHSKQTLKMLAENMHLLDALLVGSTGFNRWLWKRRILSRFYHEAAVELRVQANHEYFSHEWQSMLYWPFCGKVNPVKRYKTFMVMLLQRFGFYGPVVET